ncbi:Phosphomevalonate kinase, peroxisomal [Sesamum angolense]|uniref:Phosphomevalonate kinase, peroxisomal n=1 Tax=Sesamum angolense TaxID=2727404 RepID=A0AAE2BKX5_9LAMI|nr:Phosphomevalonate kinase, peroxisomal [Sesamum angolense]
MPSCIVGMKPLEYSQSEWWCWHMVNVEALVDFPVRGGDFVCLLHLISWPFVTQPDPVYGFSGDFTCFLLFFPCCSDLLVSQEWEEHCPIFCSFKENCNVIPRVASAPGKVLMTGGYLILERPNAGIVLSTNARFYAIVKPLCEEIKPESWAWAWTDVKLTSPQMERETMYKLSLKHLLLQCVSSSDSRNPFVEYALQYAIAAARATFDKNKKDELHKLLLLGLDITILGCNEFYSYRNQNAVRGTLLENAIADVLKTNWDHERTTFSLPPMMTLLLGEPGAGGSSTPLNGGCCKEVAKG